MLQLAITFNAVVVQLSGLNRCWDCISRQHDVFLQYINLCVNLQIQFHQGIQFKLQGLSFVAYIAREFLLYFVPAFKVELLIAKFLFPVQPA